MCGICGFFKNGWAITPEEVNRLDKMVDVMDHRGPDGRGVYSHGAGALGHRRLTIIDLQGGQQPMHLDGRASITFNGEIYNYLELKERYLGDVTLESTSDTEVLLHLLQRKGADALGLLNGMFAFAFWDKEKETLILGRDPVGQKPLFYSFTPESFLFGSELSGLLGFKGRGLELNTDALASYLFFEGYPAPVSPVKGIGKLSPGHFLVLDLKNWQLDLKPYWRNDPYVSVGDNRSESEVMAQFEESFLNSIRRHLRSDVEVGIYLSGGLDSPSLVKAAVQVVGSENVKTFTIKHENDSFDEAAAARATAGYYHTRHFEKLLSHEAFLADVEPILGSMDEPVSDPGYLAIAQVAKFSSEHVKVILSGNGGDEFFAGYAPFKALGAYRLLNKCCPAPLAALMQYLANLPKASYGYMNPAFKAQRFLRGVKHPPHLVLHKWISTFDHMEQEKILGRGILPEPLKTERTGNMPQLYRALEDAYQRLDKPDMVAVLLQMFQQFFLPTCICNHADKASMRVSQELRSPFLDVELMRFANQLPSRFKYRNGMTKYILRKYHEKGSPAGVMNRPKQGFTVPIAQWLTSSLKRWADEILDPVQMEKQGLFNASEVRRLWEDHQALRSNNAKQLWTIIVFQHWRCRFGL